MSNWLDEILTSKNTTQKMEQEQLSREADTLSDYKIMLRDASNHIRQIQERNRFLEARLGGFNDALTLLNAHPPGEKDSYSTSPADRIDRFLEMKERNGGNYSSNLVNPGEEKGLSATAVVSKDGKVPMSQAQKNKISKAMKRRAREKKAAKK